MDPYGHNHHNHHHHHHRPDEPPYPPPPHGGGGGLYPPPPPHAVHIHHEPPPPHVELYPPPPHAPVPYTADYHRQPPPPPQHVHHVPPVINHHHTDHHQKKPEKYTDNKPTVRVYCKAKTDYALTIREGKVILAPSNPSDPHQVQLTEYNPDKLDESVLWTESKDLGDGYRTVRMVNNIRLNVDAFNGDKNHGGVRDGTKIVLWEWKKDSNQRWTMVPY